MGTGATLNITSSGAHIHRFSYGSGQSGSGAQTPYGGLTHDAMVLSTLSDHTHPAGNFSGYIGLVTGGVDGNTAQTASGSNTPAGTIAGTATAAAQAFTGTQGNNEPAYVEVVWVIRVK
jgi:hypothetical protein